MRIHQQTVFICVAFLYLMTQVGFAGQKGNGGDTYLTQTREVAREVSRALLEIETIPTTDSDLDSTFSTLYEENRTEWIKALATIQVLPDSVSVSDTELHDETRNDLEVAAIASKDPFHIAINGSYLNRFGYTSRQTFVLLIHETGHWIGLEDHSQLDQFGNYFYDIYTNKYPKEPQLYKQATSAELAVQRYFHRGPNTTATVRQTTLSTSSIQTEFLAGYSSYKYQKETDSPSFHGMSESVAIHYRPFDFLPVSAGLSFEFIQLLNDGVGHLEGYAADAEVKFLAPNFRRWHPYMRLGGTLFGEYKLKGNSLESTGDGDEKKVTPSAIRTGLGLGYYMSQRMNLQFEYRFALLAHVTNVNATTNLAMREAASNSVAFGFAIGI